MVMSVCVYVCCFCIFSCKVLTFLCLFHLYLVGEYLDCGHEINLCLWRGLKDNEGWSYRLLKGMGF